MTIHIELELFGERYWIYALKETLGVPRAKSDEMVKPTDAQFKNTVEDWRYVHLYRSFLAACGQIGDLEPAVALETLDALRRDIVEEIEGLQ